MNKVSILVPVYGVEKYIGKCVRSLFEQTYENIEYIFVDDLTLDRSIDVLKSVMSEYPNVKDRVKIIKHAHNMGLAAARNTALCEATGEYVFHMDSDDYLEIDTIALLNAKAEKAGADIVTCDYNLIYDNHNKILKSWVCQNKADYIRALLTRRTSFNLSGKLIRRSLFIENAVQSVNGLNQGEDYSTFPRVAYFANIYAYVEEPLYNYVQYKKDSYTHMVDETSREQIIHAICLLIDFFENTEIVKIDSELLPDLKFYNQLTLFMISPYSKYEEIVNMLPNISRIKGSKYSFLLRFYNYCMTRRLFGLMWIMIKIKIWLKK